MLRLPSLESIQHARAVSQAAEAIAQADKTAALQRRRQALVDQVRFSALSYSADLTPGVGFLARLVDATIATQTPEANIDTIDAGVRVHDYVLPQFPVRLVPTLLRARSCLSGRKERLSRKRKWVFALVSSRVIDESSDAFGKAPSAPTPVLRIRVYTMVDGDFGAISRETQRSLASSFLSECLVSGGYDSSEIGGVLKQATVLTDGTTKKSKAHFLRRQDIEKTICALCNDSSTTRSRHTDNNHESTVESIEPAVILDAVQQYIPSRSNVHGSQVNAGNAERNAWIARCSFRKKDKYSSTIWILSGGDTSGLHNDDRPAIAVDVSADSCQIVKCSSAQSWTKPRALVAALVPELERMLKVSFKELVVDLLEGSDGEWWLLQVKAFELRQADRRIGSILPTADRGAGSRRTQSAPDRMEAISSIRRRKWRCAGRYCSPSHEGTSSSGDVTIVASEMKDDENDPSGYLSLKVVRSCEFFDEYFCRRDASRGGGFDSFSSALGFHLQHELPKRESHQLYEPQPLCSFCMHRYYLLREQWEKATKEEEAIRRNGQCNGAKRKGARRSKSVQTLKSVPPRLLPSLYQTSATTPLSEATPALGVASSASAPAFLSPNDCDKMLSMDPVIRPGPSNSYLNELAEMEAMLELREVPKPNTIVPADGKRGNEYDDASVASDVYSRIFGDKDHRRRVDDMWQSVGLKQLDLEGREKAGVSDVSKYKVSSLAVPGDHATPTRSHHCDSAKNAT